MSSVLERTDKVPLIDGEDGVIRVGATRVTLDTIAAAFDEGATPEEICQQYPNLQLADVYSVISYILRHPVEVSQYLTARSAQSAAVKKENENRFPQDGLRSRLQSRRR